MVAVKGTGTGSSPDPFDFDRVRSKVAAKKVLGTTKKVLTGVPVQKPGRDTFFRVNPDEAYWMDGFVLEYGSEDRKDQVYWVIPDLYDLDELEDRLSFVRLFTCMDKRNNVFLWHAKLPTEDSHPLAREWAESGLLVAEEAKSKWIKIRGNKTTRKYDVYAAGGDYGEPEWPDLTYRQLIELGFKDRLIDSIDHSVLRELRGEI
jgi:hypothetical protein